MPDVPKPGGVEERLYVPDHAGWRAAIKQDWNKEYCYIQRPGEEFYHLLVTGEIYLQSRQRKILLELCPAPRLHHSRASVLAAAAQFSR